MVSRDTQAKWLRGGIKLCAAVRWKRQRIDLMVVGEISPQDLALPLRRAPESHGREINPTVYTTAEFGRKRAANDHFLTQVLNKPRLLALGNKDELGKVAGG
jgi:hypothetical protein